VRGGGHCSGTPTLRMPSRLGSSWERYVGSSLIAVQAARKRVTVKVGLNARPALLADRASSRRPSCARPTPNTKYIYGKFRLPSIERRYHAIACSQLPRWSFARPAPPIQM
jgi:hypothetical protein